MPVTDTTHCIENAKPNNLQRRKGHKDFYQPATALGDASRHKPDRCAAISLMASATPLMRLCLFFIDNEILGAWRKIHRACY